MVRARKWPVPIVSIPSCGVASHTVTLRAQPAAPAATPATAPFGALKWRSNGPERVANAKPFIPSNAGPR